ncbi:MAG TPA: serine/threonine-protein kinase, partial [Chloroflexota bacterium]|nr:serine/threonine-protein kinase [Chloroflexota bacterium]
MSNSASAALDTGDRLAGRYELGERIGGGGMGRVFRAHDVLLDRQVAVKILDEGATADEALGRAAAEEARAAASLNHPGIAKVFDSGIHDGRRFVVMELVPGRTLREILVERGPLPAAEALDLAAQVADALDEAHRHNIVHCDIKPQNVIVTPAGAAKLVDFGIARAASVTSNPADHEIRGSAAYVSPEQVSQGRVDGRSDVYSLGAVLYEMLTGRPPFQGQNVAAIISQRLVVDPPSPRSLVPSISPQLEGVLLAALARDPARRCPSAGTFRDALREAARVELAAAQAQTVRVWLRPFGGWGWAWPPRSDASRARAAKLAGLGALAAILLAVAILAVALV